MKISIDAQIAIRSFSQSLIAGDFGPDDSRDGRSQFFLKDPSIVGQAVSVFLYRLELDQDGRVLNHDEAEDRVHQFIRWTSCPAEEPDPPFSDDELGVMYLDEPPIHDQ
jgi:hypothetical protein